MIQPRITTRFAVIALASLLISLGPATQTVSEESGKPLEILSVTPAGEEVPQSREIVIQFDRSVVPVGRMEREAHELPISIEPALECEWRWLDTSALSCRLAEDEALRPATRRCRIGYAGDVICAGRDRLLSIGLHGLGHLLGTFYSLGHHRTSSSVLIEGVRLTGQAPRTW